jgi:hypothetical protein
MYCGNDAAYTDLLPVSSSMASHPTYATNWPSFTGTMARPSRPQNSRYAFLWVDLDQMVRVDHAKSSRNRRARAAPPVVISLPLNRNRVRAGSAGTGARREAGSLRGAGDAMMDSVVGSMSKILPREAAGDAPRRSCPWQAGTMIASASLAL